MSGTHWLGPSRRERTLRRLAGGAAATSALACVLTLLLGDGDGDGDVLAPLLLVSLAGAICTALTWPLERRWRASRPVARYALLGGVAAAAAVLAFGDREYALLSLAVATPLGVTAGALAAAVAQHTPRHWLVPTMTAGVLTLGVVLGAAALDARPPYPGSWLVVTGVSSAPGARPLAERVADGLRASDAPASDEAWSAVAADVVTLVDGQLSIGYAQERPIERRITVGVNGDTACVIVMMERVTVLNGACVA